MLVRVEAAALLAMTLVLAGIVLVARPAGRTARTMTQALGAIPVASVAQSILAIVSTSPSRWRSSCCSAASSRS
jgi:hypothetical protein